MMPPEGFELETGIYAVWVSIDDIKFRGAMHWGPIPTFDDEDQSLEVFLLGLDGTDLSSTDTSRISVQIVERLRDIIKFPSIDELTRQIDSDVVYIRKVLQE